MEIITILQILNCCINIIDSGHCTIYDTKDSDIEVLKHSMVVMTDVGTMMLLKMKFNRDIENVITPIIGYDDMYIFKCIW